MGTLFAIEGALELVYWLAFAVIGQAKSTVVDGDAGGGAYFFVGTDCIRRRDVHRAHEPLGAIGADGEKREANFREASANGGEVGAVRGVSCKIDCSRSAFDDVAAPESFIAVGEGAAGKMAGGNGRDADFVEGVGGLPPIHFLNLRILRDAVGGEARADSERDRESRLPPGGNAAQRGQVEMIVVVVTLQDQINGGKLIEVNSWGAVAGRPDPGKRAGAMGPDGIAKNVQAFELD